MLKHLLFLFIFPTLICQSEARPGSFFVPSGNPNGCGYDSCPAYNISANINVHLVPHSHDDVGWLKTVDQYYYGSRQFLQLGGVQYILDSVIKELSLDPSKRFIQVETAFFWRWWYEQPESIQEITRQLVEEGRFEFVGAGWSMNDEACTHYSAIIDNFALGFKTLGDIFGECAVPRIAWQIDTFGHSREQARIFALLGFDGLFFSRADYKEKEERKENKTLQMIWHGSGVEEETLDTSIFTGVFSGHYNHPQGFCFDVLCDDRPIVDNEELEGFNVEERINLFYERIQEEVTSFSGPAAKHIMFTMGDDFQYMNARQNYKNMDKLIKNANERLSQYGINVLYSTPSCYMKAIYEESIRQNITEWPTKTDDFLPLSIGSHSYWSGFFTSRPTLKYMERYSNSLLQLSKQVEAMFQFPAKILGEETEVDILRRALSTLQHHDAITGTEKQHVADDYAQRLWEGTEAVMSKVGPTLFGYTGFIPDAGFAGFLCPLLNISQCAATEQFGNISMIIYNPLARSISKVFSLPVPSDSSVAIYNSDGEQLNSNIQFITEEVINIPGRTSQAESEVFFLASDIPALGFQSYFMTISPGPAADAKPIKMLPKNIVETAGLTLNVEYYLSTNDTENNQISDAYIFRPESANKKNVKRDFEISYTNDFFYESQLFYEEKWASIIARQYRDEPWIEVNWLMGPLPNIKPGVEVVLTYKSVDDNPSTDEPVQFWTDSNGRQMVKRIKNYRSSFNFTDADIEPVSSNYYPVTSAIKADIYDENGSTNKTLTVLNDRSQGGTSLNHNEIELMVHRRLFMDRTLGDDPLNEYAFGAPLVARGKHFFYLGPSEEEPRLRREKSQELYMPPFTFFYPTEMSLEDWIAVQAPKSFSGLNVESLPTNVHILTLERWGAYENNEILIRFEHLFEGDEDETLSGPVSFEWTSDLFNSFSVENVRQMSLGGNVELNTMNRLKWTGEKEFERTDSRKTIQSLPITVTLQPMEIQTYLVKITN